MSISRLLAAMATFIFHSISLAAFECYKHSYWKKTISDLRARAECINTRTTFELTLIYQSSFVAKK